MKISIVVPVYNVEKYVENCILSLVNQTYRDLEIILVNDGSKDKSRIICEKYKDSDDRIIIVDKSNGGLSSARNYGIRNSHGDYIMFIDGDDALEVNAVEKLTEVLQEHPSADFIQFYYTEVDSEGNPLYNETHTGDIKIVTDEYEKYNLLYKIGGPAASACTKIYKRDLFDGPEYKEGIIHEDEYIITDILSRTNTVIYYDISLYKYYFRDNSIITSKYSKKKTDIFIVIDKRLNVLKAKNFSDLLNKEYEKLFYAVLRLYFMAKENGAKEDLDLIIGQIDKIPATFADSLSGKNRILFKMIKKNKKNINIYYYIKKVL